MAVLELTVNGSRRRAEVDPEQTLLSVLRDELDLTGAKYGCGEGQCGACTVLVDGRPTRACVTRAAGLAGKTVVTVEGLEENGRLHPVQQAFLEVGALQCGYCTPGMIVEAVALLRRAPNADEVEIARAMQGHICRCCTYPRIVRAVRQAAQASRGATATKQEPR
jgi:aerobic-type carbon monoxide dehydrogenase small subunit (CoxS/CutS family)